VDRPQAEDIAAPSNFSTSPRACSGAMYAGCAQHPAGVGLGTVGVNCYGR